ncbi:5-carboxymethyl-2-hydroxymuconate Delta-isomerase [Chitinophaga polysaccharea]|uniref:5-carboxymethyl-2-hydroxymuconate Delta-isomerase n=1 Tax=Chitinophaga TaxID=79328 RepID=UPI0014555E56|nr:MULTISPECIES: 5-carboxymethyl-2-hydroxymuconate Delta-isomerase [Chitinophaga]NLR58244.1 5-carboxymethyl-2-hydroxymuconate Delta-isomerase [Chitinophaga polysaccharea]NLU90770.1 5-carboxymethyl-2-hydroxymuconate Delta-isomerase [Chitinophaga sp. Ak27]
MPHFVIECSNNVLGLQSPERIMDTVYQAAESTGLFAKNDIKVRLNAFTHYKLGDGKDSFLHIFASIMGGRTKEQKSHLSSAIIEQLAPLLPEVSFLSINVDDFDPDTYCNRALINPANVGKDRHF